MEIREAVEKLALKYYPDDSEEHREANDRKRVSALCMIQITIDHVTGRKPLNYRAEQKNQQ